MVRIIVLTLACVALPAQSEDPAPDVRAQVQELEGRMKAARAAGDKEAVIAVRRDFAALVERVAGPRHPQLATALDNLAGSYRDQGRMDLAVEPLERALDIREKALGPEHPDTAAILNNLGLALAHVGQHERSGALLKRALTVREKVLGPDHVATAGSLNSLATHYRAIGRYDLALPLLERSLATIEKSRPSPDELTATALNNLASVYESLGFLDRALPRYERALAISEAALGKDHVGTAAKLNNLAGLYRAMGLYDRAVPLLERVLAITERHYDPESSEIALACNNLAELYKTVGRYDQALALFERSASIAGKAFGPGHDLSAETANNLAGMYVALGRYDRAEALLESALAVREGALGPEHPGVAVILNNQANLLRRQKQDERARPLQERALVITRKTFGEGHADTATAMGNLAGIYAALGLHDKALPLLERSVAIREKALGADHPSVAIGLSNLADFHRDRGDPARALPFYQRAHRIATLAAYPELARETQGNLRRAHAALGQPDLAIFFGKQAVNTMQGIRAQSPGLPREMQQSLVLGNAAHYRALADLLIEAGRLAEAQQVLAMLKEDEFFEFIRRDAGGDPRVTRMSWTPAEEVFASGIEATRREAATFAAERRALDLRARSGLSEGEAARRADLNGRLAALGRRNGELLESLARELPAAQKRLAEAQRRDHENRVAGTRAQLAELGEGVALLHYLILGERMRIVLTTREKLVASEAVVPEGELFRLLVAFRRSAEDPRADPRDAGKRLYDLLIAPVAADLAAQRTTTLLLSLDGPLRYIPFAALHDGERYLVERYGLALHTAAAAGRLTDLPQARWTLAGFGLTRAIGRYSALPSVEEELKGIVGPQGIAGEAVFDGDFTAEAIGRALARDYTVVHLASHFLFTPGNEADSFLLLGDGSRLTLRDLRLGDYHFDRLDLLTLSACETAMLGGREADGREVEGFGALAQRKGAKGVLATLWPIADSSTAQLMQHFYRLRESRGLTKTEALRQAQVALLRGQASAPYAHPFFWAPFILMGNGR